MGILQVRDLPPLRDELFAWLARPERQEVYRMLGARYGWAGRKASSEVSDGVLARERGAVRVAELFYVSSDMTDVAESAGRTLPSVSLLREDLPAERGVMVFDRPIGNWEDEDHGGRVASIVACSWWCDAEAVFICFYSWRDLNLQSAQSAGDLTEEDVARLMREQPRLVHDNESRIPFGVEHSFAQISGSILDTWGRTVLSAWLLMQQPGVSTREPYRYGQMDRKWLKRRRLQQSPITVVRLRYAATARHGDGGMGREYHHRWMVRGHWRRQWYPSRGAHIPLWIAPHIKGPEDAPIKTGERVNAWVR
jgi:hypothetical protein